MENEHPEETPQTPHTDSSESTPPKEHVTPDPVPVTTNAPSAPVESPEAPVAETTVPAPKHQYVDVTPLQERMDAIKQELAQTIVGQEKMIHLLLAGIFSRGHILLEGVPGIAKTMTARLLSETLNIGFSRIQFTPDLMPADVIGTNVFNLKTSEFEYKSGPIFSNLVLIDEINRAPAKTQASLFEVMQEEQITVDGTTYHMEKPFIVIATQNPIEQEGTYKLPEAQLDRFMFRIRMEHPSLEEEKAILNRFRDTLRPQASGAVKAVIEPADFDTLHDIIQRVHIREDLIDYIANVVHETRNTPSLLLGASPRASLAIMHTSKTMAALAGRDFVTPDDIRMVSFPVLNHRIILSPEREMEGASPEDIISELLDQVEVPR